VNIDQGVQKVEYVVPASFDTPIARRVKPREIGTTLRCASRGYAVVQSRS
jgi:hypothetical protein